MTEKRRLTVTLNRDDQAAVETITNDMGSPSASAAGEASAARTGYADRQAARQNGTAAIGSSVNDTY